MMHNPDETVPLKPEEIQAAIEIALLHLSEQVEARLIAAIRPVLAANLDRGRVHTFIEGDLSRVYKYVQKVADTYRRLNPLLNRLQIGRKAQAWEPVFKRMRLWAYNFLMRKGFYATPATHEATAECATEAAMSLLDAHFPYDTEFDPWLHVIVQNACRKFIRKGTKPSQVPSQDLTAIDDELNPVVDPQSQGWEETNHRRNALLEAIAQLSEARRQVIEYTYFEGLPSEEIAQKMGKTIGAIYSLRFNALEDLRKILT